MTRQLYVPLKISLQQLILAAKTPLLPPPCQSLHMPACNNLRTVEQIFRKFNIGTFY